MWFFGVLALAMVTFTASAGAVLKSDPPSVPANVAGAVQSSGR